MDSTTVFAIIKTVLAALADSRRHGPVEDEVLVPIFASREESHQELNDNGHTAFLWLARDSPERLLEDCHDELDDLLRGTCFIACNKVWLQLTAKSCKSIFVVAGEVWASA